MKRLAFLPLLPLGILALAPVRLPKIVTYRDIGCGCCEGWVRAARAAGYTVDLHDLEHAARLRKFGLTEATAGCHTSLVDRYIVEGHVPLAIVAKLVRERPPIRGITFPGMPSGVPGMDGPRTGGTDILTLESVPRVYARV